MYLNSHKLSHSSQLYGCPKHEMHGYVVPLREGLLMSCGAIMNHSSKSSWHVNVISLCVMIFRILNVRHTGFICKLDNCQSRILGVGLRWSLETSGLGVLKIWRWSIETERLASSIKNSNLMYADQCK